MTTDPGDIDLRRIEYLPLRDLKADPRNPKAHAQDAISSSVTRFGFVEPIILDERTGYIASGHGRVSALTQMRVDGKPAPDGVKVSKKRGWLVPVVMWRSRNDMEAAAALIAFNRTTELGGWVDDALLDLLHDLEDETDATALGFDDDAIAALEALAEADIVAQIDQAPAKPKRTAEELDAIPEARGRKKAKKRTKPGDLWVLGRHRVLCGDATVPEHVNRLMDGAAPMLLLTDPPYSSGGFQDANRSSGSIGSRLVDGTQPEILNDKLSTRGYLALMKSVLSLSPTIAAYAFTDWRMWVNLFDVLESTGYSVRSMIVWDKGTPGMGAVWRSQHELVAFGVRAKLPKADLKQSLGNVRTIGRSGNLYHPTQKPVKLLTDLLRPLEGMGLVGVYDPFAGAGSTMIAAEEAGYSSFSMELDPEFVDVIVERWEGLTGETAVKISA